MSINNSEIFDTYEFDDDIEQRDRRRNEQDEQDDRPTCRIINSYEEEEHVGVVLKHIFPDSNTFIVFEANIGVHYFGHIDGEILAPMEMLEYEPLLVTQKGVLLAYTDSEEIERYVFSDGIQAHFMSEPNYTFSTEDRMKVTIHTEDKDFNTSILSKELVGKSEYDTIFRDEACDIYAYPSGQFIVSQTAVHCTDGTAVATLASKGIGSLFGYHLDVDDDNVAAVLYEDFKLVNRLTITVLLLVHCSSGIPHILSSRENALMELDRCADCGIEDIPVINGVPMLIKETPHGAFFTMFTPAMQEISIFNPRQAFSPTEFGNGVFIKDERVLIVDVGALAFCVPTKKGSRTYTIRNRKVKTPVKHIGGLHELSSEDS